VVPDQLFDFTRDRQRSFFGEGLVVHVGVEDPFCPDLSNQIVQATQSTGAEVHIGGAFITIEGPRFSTRGESELYRTWGLSIIGMTTSPEAFLAREAEICYAVMAHVTDYDVWHVTEAPVSVEAVIAVLNRNTKIAQEAVRIVASAQPTVRNCTCGQALKNARITDPSRIPAETLQRLAPIVGKYYP
jgi:5'-methylthioadenosine phosphorylase